MEETCNIYTENPLSVYIQETLFFIVSLLSFISCFKVLASYFYSNDNKYFPKLMAILCTIDAIKPIFSFIQVSFSLGNMQQFCMEVPCYIIGPLNLIYLISVFIMTVRINLFLNSMISLENCENTILEDMAWWKNLLLVFGFPLFISIVASFLIEWEHMSPIPAFNCFISLRSVKSYQKVFAIIFYLLFQFFPFLFLIIQTLIIYFKLRNVFKKQQFQLKPQDAFQQNQLIDFDKESNNLNDQLRKKQLQQDEYDFQIGVLQQKYQNTDKSNQQEVIYLYFWYPVIFIIIWTPINIQNILQYITQNADPILWLDYIGFTLMGLNGFLNSLVFGYLTNLQQ